MESRIRFVAIIVIAFLCSALPVHAADLTITVNAASHIRTIPETMYGGNLTAWDGTQNGSNSTFNNLLIASGRKYMRWCGGSWGDAYLWSDMEGPGDVNGWIVSYSETLNLLNILSQPGETVYPTLQPIVNFPGYWYGVDHSDAEAIAAAVAWVQDQSARTPTAQYWEIGNEIYGPWEAGWFSGMRGSYYGDKYADFYLAMKAVNPNIKIGAVAQEYDTADWWNPGLWTRELLIAARAKGVVPDFLIIHQYPCSDQDATNNPTLLGARVNDIASFTSSLNNIIANTIGPQYVGQIKYWMTEWDAGATTSYDRRQCYVNALFHSQYALEMAKNAWEGANAWAQWEYSSPSFVYPVWYVHPMLINKFGRNMVVASSSSSTVRAYSSIDASDNLTMFIVNNSPTADLTAQINISGMTIGTGGQRWIMEPAGNIVSGGLTIQDRNNISINGTVHPDPLTVNSLAPQAFTSGGSFTITLPKSCMMLLRMPSIGTDTTPPAAPTGLTATGGEELISLNWNDNGEGDLASYNVYRSSTSGSGYTKQNCSPVTSSNYTDNLAMTGQTYYYIVTAVDTSWNESGYSNQASAAATANIVPPAAPTGLTATAITGAISLNWNANGESDLAGYNVYRGTASGGPYSKKNSSLVADSSYTDNSAANGTTYYYIVTAVDTVMNESGGSNEASATSVDVTPPARPTNLTATAAGSTVLLDWDDNAEPDLYGYNVYRGACMGCSYNKLNTSVITSSSYADSSGTIGTTYYYVVRAVDYSSNISGNSNEASAAPTETTPPAAPTGLTATGGNSTVSLDWNDNSESDMSGYNVYRSTTSGSGYSKLNGSLINKSTSNYTDNAINGGTTYYYVVRAVDTSNNESGSSNEASATPTDTIPPSAPTGLSASAGNQTVLLNWNNNSEPDINSYNVYRSTTSGGTYTRQNGTPLSNSDFNDANVANGTTYYYIVTAVDTSSNESANSGEVSATPTSSTIYTFAGINAANTNYNAYACDVDVFPFAGLSSNRNSQVEATDAQYVNISTDDTTEWATADPGSSDEIFLWVEMKINESPAAISQIDLTFDGYTGGTIAATHRIFVLTAGADWTLDASWTQVGTNQNISPGTYATMTRSITSNISSYIDGTGKITWAVYETTSSEAMHVNYLEMTVTATDTTPPAAPTGLTATAGIGTVSLDWNDNAESDLAGYDVYRSTTSGSGYAKQNSSLLTNSAYNDSNVSNGTTYYYVVTAADTGSNESGYSSEVSATPNYTSTGTGAILREWWSGISGTAVSDLTANVNYPANSTGRELITKLQGPTNWADDYGTLIQGYVIPPADGDYTFWIVSDANSELWLSTDNNPSNAILIAYIPGSSQSSPRSLVAGQKYYIEALHKAGTGNDNISVSWQGPALSQQVIDGLYLSPCCLDFRDFADLAEQWNRSDCNAGNNWCSGQDRDRNGNVQIDDLKTFAEEWLLF